MIRYVGGWCIFLAFSTFAADVAAQAPSPPPGVFYMATSFCPAKSKNIHPRSTLVKVYGALLMNPLPKEIAEAEGSGEYLLPCELGRGGGANRKRYMSEVFPHFASSQGDLCPSGSVPADGRTMSISSFAPLFTLLGTYYGGDGISSFALPDLKLKFGAVVRQAGGTLRFCIDAGGVYPDRD